jgi:hypothetical protein
MSQIPPLLLFRSFLTVVSGFLVAQFVLMAVMWLLSYFFFPDFYQFAIQDVQQKQLILETRPDAGKPPVELFTGIILITAVCYFGLGCLVVCWSPLAGLAHGVLVALLLFVFFAQGFFGGAEELKLFDLLYLLILPPALLGGAYFADLRCRGTPGAADVES